MPIFKKLLRWVQLPKASEDTSTNALEARFGAVESDINRLSHDVAMVLMPETRQLPRNYPR